MTVAICPPLDEDQSDTIAANAHPPSGCVVQQSIEGKDGRTFLASDVLSWAREGIHIGHSLDTRLLEEDGKPSIQAPLV